jgi:hypothetical protein
MISLGISPLYLAKRSSFCYCSAQPVFSESPMQNLKPIHFSLVADRPSAVSDALDRVTGVAPAPLLPGEQEAEYATHVARIVALAKPRDAVEDLLTRDVIDLSWESAAPIKGRAFESRDWQRH